MTPIKKKKKTEAPEINQYTDKNYRQSTRTPVPTNGTTV